MSAFHAIPKDSRELLESAVRMHQMDRAEMTTEELVLMVYNLGRIDGRMGQLQAIDAYVDQMIGKDIAARYEGGPERDLNTRGEPMKPGR